MDLPKFRLFRDPVGEGVFKRSDETCAACGRSRGWIYDGGMFGEGDNDRLLCPWCIADGSAAAKFDATFNDPTIYPAPDGSPQLSNDDREEVELRTPGYETWQGTQWKMCCGRACEYIGEAKPGDLVPGGRWEEAATSVLDDLSTWPEQEKREFLESIGNADPAAYVYECILCAKLSGYFDMS